MHRHPFAPASLRSYWSIDSHLSNWWSSLGMSTKSITKISSMHHKPMLDQCLDLLSSTFETWNHLCMSLRQHLNGSPLLIFDRNLASSQRSVHLDHIPGFGLLSISIAKSWGMKNILWSLIFRHGCPPSEVGDKPELCRYNYLQQMWFFQ